MAAILPALIPDIEAIYDVYFKAFQTDRMGSLMLDILFPSGVNEEFRKAHTVATAQYWHHSSNQYTYKAVDIATGDIVGMALGDVYMKERSEEERKNPGVEWLQGEQRERAETILNPLWEVREKLFGGRRYICAYNQVGPPSIPLHPVAKSPPLSAAPISGSPLTTTVFITPFPPSPLPPCNVYMHSREPDWWLTIF